VEANVIDTLITQAQVASKSCVTAADNWLGYLQNAKEEALRVAASLTDAYRLADAERARLRAEIERAHSELAEATAELGKVRKEIERERKQIELEKANFRKLMNDVVAQKVA
jgi:hypothetical protein